MRPSTLCLTLLLGAVASLSAQDEAPAPTSEGRRLALLVGCSDYPVLARTVDEATYERTIRLKGTEHDVELMKTVLVERLGFAEGDVRTLVGWPSSEGLRPSRKNILRAFSDLVKEAGKGDYVVVLLAGHGSQQLDRTGDELDGLDEVFLPADVARCEPQMKGRIPGAISDDEIGRFLDALGKKGAFVWALFDCCHSGTMMRGSDDLEIRARQIDPSVLGVPAAEIATRGGAPTSEGGGLALGEDSRVVAFYAAQSWKKAPEMALPRGDAEARPHGLLTYSVASAISRLGGGATYDEILSEVLAGYQTLPYTDTVPFAEGNLAARASVVADPIRGGASRERLLAAVAKSTTEIELDVGRLGGIEPGARVRLFPIGRDDAPLGEAEVVSVDLLRSKARTRKDLLLEKGSRYRARLSFQAVRQEPLKIGVVYRSRVQVPEEKLPEQLVEAFADTRITRVSPFDAEWLVVLDGDECWLEAARAGGGLERFALDVRSAKFHLLRVFRARNLRRLAAQDLPSLPGGLSVAIHYRAPGGGRFVPLPPGGAVAPGGEIMIKARKTTRRPIDLTVLYVGADFKIEPIVPEPGVTARLGLGDDKEITIGPFGINDLTLGQESLVVLAVPRGETDPVIDFSWLRQDSLDVRHRGTEQRSELEQAVASLAFGDENEGVAMRGITVGSGSGQGGGAAAGSVISFRTEYPLAIAAPAAYAAETVEIPKIEGEEGTVPDPWRIGPRVCRDKSTRLLQTPDMIVAGGDAPNALLIDLDDSDARKGLDEASLKQLIAERAFDFEVAFRFEPGRRIAFYDGDDDGAVDLVLEDRDGGPDAELRHLLVDGEWKTEEVKVPFLKSSYLPATLAGSGGWKSVVLRFNALLAKAASKPLEEDTGKEDGR